MMGNMVVVATDGAQSPFGRKRVERWVKSPLSMVTSQVARVEGGLKILASVRGSYLG